MIYIIVMYLENSLHIESLQKHFVFSMKNGVYVVGSDQQAFNLRKLLLAIPRSCRVKVVLYWMGLAYFTACPASLAPS